MKARALLTPFRTDILASFAIAIVLLAAYLLTPLEFLGNDARPAILTSVSLFHEHDFDLDEYEGMIRGRRRDLPYYVLSTADEQLVSRFGMGTPLAALPLFAPVLAQTRSFSVADGFAVGRKAASMYVAFAAALLFLCARRLQASLGHALVIALVYGLGTTAFSVCSQALWQHGPAQFFLVLALWALLHEGTLFSWLAGCALGWMFLCRPPDGLLIVSLTAAMGWKWRHRPRALAAFALGAMPLVIAQLLYNAAYFGEPWRFGQIGQVVGRGALPHASYWQNPMLEGLAGQLVSPSRGLFVYSPVFVWLLWKPQRAWAAWSTPVRAGMIGSLLLLLMLSRYYGWYGGWCFGYRMLSDVAPILVLALLPALSALERTGRVLFAASVVASVAIHAAGAYNYSPGGWDMHPDLDHHLERLWSVTDSQLVYVFTQPKVHVSP